MRSGQLVAKGAGWDLPIASQKTAEGRARNQRIQLLPTAAVAKVSSDSDGDEGEDEDEDVGEDEDEGAVETKGEPDREPAVAPVPSRPSPKPGGDANQRLLTLLTEASDRLAAFDKATQSGGCSTKIAAALAWARANSKRVAELSGLTHHIMDHELNFQYTGEHMTQFARYRAKLAAVGKHLESCAEDPGIEALGAAMEEHDLVDDLYYAPRRGPAAIARCRRLREVRDQLKKDPTQLKGAKRADGGHDLAIHVPGLNCEYSNGVYCLLGKYATSGAASVAFDEALKDVTACYPHHSDEKTRHSPVAVRQVAYNIRMYPGATPVLRLTVLPPTGGNEFKLLLTMSLSKY